VWAGNAGTGDVAVQQSPLAQLVTGLLRRSPLAAEEGASIDAVRTSAVIRGELIEVGRGIGCRRHQLPLAVSAELAEQSQLKKAQ